MQDRFTVFDFLFLVLVVALAAGARVGYLSLADDMGKKNPAWQVQGDPGLPPLPNKLEDKPLRERDLIANLVKDSQFSGRAPLSDGEETTAHEAPGYYWLFSLAVRFCGDDAESIMRWIQAALGTLTVLCYYLFARRAFGTLRVAFVAGILLALYPFWILNTAELNDGVLASFGLSLVLMLGTRGGLSGGVVTSTLFGLALAGLVLVRATFLPFALIGLIWYILRCHKQPLGWLCALVAFLFFGIPVATWTVRNVQAFNEPIPISDSTFLHLWIGNNPASDGTELDDYTLKRTLPRVLELQEEKNQSLRYNMLMADVQDEVRSHPRETCERRLQSALAFLLGGNYFSKDHKLADKIDTDGQGPIATPPSWLGDDTVKIALAASLLAMFYLSFLGWRWSFDWRAESRLASIAVVWLPLPYILSHAEHLSGPRLPLDGVLLCFAAFALIGTAVNAGPPPSGDKKKKFA